MKSREFVLKDVNNPADQFSIAGPDERGEYTLRVVAADGVVTISYAGLAELQVYVGKLRTGTE